MDAFTNYIDQCGHLCEWAINMTVGLARSISYEPDIIYWMEYLRLNKN